MEDPKRDSDKPNTMQLLSDGIIGVLQDAIEKKKKETGQGDDQVCALLDLDHEEYYGFHTYTSTARSQIINFCGWSDVIRP